MPIEDLQTLDAPASAEQFTDALTSLCRDAGMSHFMAIRLRGVNLEDVVQVFHNSPDQELVQGMRHWSLQRMLDDIRSSGPPVVFGQGAKPAPEVPGYSSGVAALVRERRGGCVVYFGSGAADLRPEQVMPVIRSTILAATHCIGGLVKLHALSCPLSERELECLRLAITGELSSREIAKILDISARTVEHYLENARSRLGADSTLAAGVKAIQQGWMELPDGGHIEITG